MLGMKGLLGRMLIMIMLLSITRFVDKTPFPGVLVEPSNWFLIVSSSSSQLVLSMRVF